MVRRPLEQIQNGAATQIKRAEIQYRYAVYLFVISVLSWVLCFVLILLTKNEIERMLIGVILFLGLTICFYLYNEMKIKRLVFFETKKTFQPGVNVVGNILNFMDRLKPPSRTTHRIKIDDDEYEEI